MPVKNPINAPTADLIDFFTSRLLQNPPIKAPKKGPINKPKGPRKRSPTTNPITLPTILFLSPPNFFTPQMEIN